MALAISPEFLVFVVVLMIASRVFRFRSFAMHMLSGLKYWAAAPKDNMEEIVLLQRKVLVSSACKSAYAVTLHLLLESLAL